MVENVNLPADGDAMNWPKAMDRGILIGLIRHDLPRALARAIRQKPKLLDALRHVLPGHDGPRVRSQVRKVQFADGFEWPFYRIAKHPKRLTRCERHAGRPVHS